MSKTTPGPKEQALRAQRESQMNLMRRLNKIYATRPELKAAIDQQKKGKSGANKKRD